ncbi:hypothetical protein J7E88_12720 [Streptomyces sp. ISL-10]|uniref:hypothetical protein n=1 Tax=Streptomyces sp. ISL-10 TaxID=2819172 RepID=UPI001BE88B72|nr:hypothetical protein [Streptomyces sp. ISL-10]MBT2366147.1 hypothetical protein [Streptomyces sp. ISL-10]
MAGRGRLKAAVYVQDPATREELILLPGESPDPEVAELITNPDAWDAVLEESEPEPIAVGEPEPTEKDSASEAAGAEAGGGAKKPQARRSRSSGS